MANVKEITDIMKSRSKEDVELVSRAYKKAEEAHEGQKRLSGEPYFNHVFETAKELAKLQMGAQTIAAGLLHDTLEERLVSEEDLLSEFGQEVLFLIKGVTKLGKLRYQGVERHVESLRKLFIATAQDIRVLIIRLADRLHNIKTLDGHESEDKRKRIAIETIEVFASLANRLGIGSLKGDLEDYAFPYAYPKEYEEVLGLLKQKKKIGEKYLEKVRRTLQKELAKQQIKNFRTDYRIKHIYSLYKKLLRYDMNIDKIHDIIAIRIIISSVEDCYRVLGIIHSIWRPLPDRIKDYIATPKPNGYQSLHTTIFTGDGGVVEVQIRTEEMHNEAEYGIASHLSYKGGLLSKKGGRKKNDRHEKELQWMQQLLEWQKNVSASDQFLKSLKHDFFEHRVFVFTPRGDVIDLPIDSSPIDFAYSIHTDIGNHVSGAKVNGKLASLDTKLKSGDIVQIITKKESRPTRKWMENAKTTLAQKQIHLALNENRDTKSKSFLRSIGRHRLL